MIQVCMKVPDNSVIYVFVFLLFSHPHCRPFTPRFYNPNARGSDACREQQTVDQNTRQLHNGGPHLNVWSAQCQDHRWRKQRTEHKQHAPIEIEIPDPARNRN